MADISSYLADIMAAVYGEDVRGSIHDAIEIINDVSEVVLTTGTAVTGPTSSSTGFYDDSLYLNTSTMELWKCVGTNLWQSQGVLKGDPGAAGVGISSIDLTSSVGLVDTYTITYTDGNSTTFTVTNGQDGTDGEDGNKWYRGTAISGKDPNPTVFSGSGITLANPNDFYLNPSEGAVYHCVTGGNASNATWSYDFTMTGGGGGGTGVGVGGEVNDLLALAVVHALELLAAADGPVHGIGLDAQLPLHLVQQIEGILTGAVHLIDKDHHGRRTHTTDMHQLARLRLHSLRSVNYDNNRIDSRQRAVGILGKILVSGCVEDVDLDILVVETHHRRSHRDTSLTLDLHKVGCSTLLDFVAEILCCLFGDICT